MSREPATVSVKNMTVTLPEELFELVEDVRRKEHRTRSELVREALRRYIRAADAEPPLYAWQKKIVDERLEAYRRNPDDTLSWEQIEANARAVLAPERR
jgi:Arc/MetJ-type ribon-helix-helix transcriptional regulator